MTWFCGLGYLMTRAFDNQVSLSVEALWRGPDLSLWNFPNLLQKNFLLTSVILVALEPLTSVTPEDDEGTKAMLRDDSDVVSSLLTLVSDDPFATVGLRRRPSRFGGGGVSVVPLDMTCISGTARAPVASWDV